MICLESLDISAGVCSVVGSGGKTTLLRALAETLVRQGHTVILATTTHFLPFSDTALVTGDNEDELAQTLGARGVVCAGAWASGQGGAVPAGAAGRVGSLRQTGEAAQRANISERAGGTAGRGAAGQTGEIARRSTDEQDLVKLGPSPIPMERLAQLANYVLVEADGAHRRPLKAHASYEPVVPACSKVQVLVVGASGLMQPIGRCVHRPELFCQLVGCNADDPATPERVARAIAREIEADVLAPTRIVVNQADTPETLALATRLEDELRRLGVSAPLLAGSLKAA